MNPRPYPDSPPTEREFLLPRRRNIRQTPAMPNAAPKIPPGETFQRFATAAEWVAWLEKNHTATPVIWIQYAKKSSLLPSVTYAEALDAALCFGWIDGQVARFDEEFYLQRFTPRRARSIWSKINVAKAETLIADGRMRPAGQREIDAARADGRWATAYSSPRNATVPPDLQTALDATPAAREFFATLNGKNRYAILTRIELAKRPATRARRIAEFVAMLAESRTIYPQRPA